MKDESEMSMEELEKLEEVKFDIDKNAINVNEGFCPECNEKMVKHIENKSLFDGTVTFHIIKFRCQKCQKEYLDLEEAQKYDLFLKLEKSGKQSLIELANGSKAKVYA